MSTATHFIHNPLKLPLSKVTHAMDVQVRDRQCNRINMTLLLPNEPFVQLMLDVENAMEWSIRECADIYPFTLA